VIGLSRKFTTFLVPSFEKELRKLDRTHRIIILNRFRKIRKSGLHALKILRVKGNYLLCEVKVKKPPYRLYVFVDQERKIFYLARWEHKNKQEKVIKSLSKRLEEAFEYGIEEMIERYFS
jgi:mRNA-degrading endonuclease RelE of RelBE toxin-antitoxin system